MIIIALLALGLALCTGWMVWEFRDALWTHQLKEVPEKYDPVKTHRLELDCGIIPRCGGECGICHGTWNRMMASRPVVLPPDTVNLMPLEWGPDTIIRTNRPQEVRVSVESLLYYEAFWKAMDR